MWKGNGVAMSLSRNKRPLYLQIQSILKDRILHGLYPLGTNIPSEPQLEKEFGVSKITVRGAIKALVQDGYVETSSGKGTRVVRNTSTTKRSTSKRFTEALVEEGHRVEKTLLGAAVVACEADSEQGRLFGERCIRVERLYKLDGAPYIHYAHHLPARLSAGGKTELDELGARSLYDWLEERGVAIARFRDEFGVALAPEAAAPLLGVEPGAPLLKRLRYSYDAAGEVVEYSEGYYNSALHAYVVHSDV